MVNVDLDIGPAKRNISQSESIKGTFESNGPSGYTKYVYKKSNSGTFTLSRLSYGGKKFTLIVTTSIHDVSKVVVYFKQVEGTLLAIHVSTNVKQYYYTNYNTSTSINEYSWFDEFITVCGKVLDESTEIKEILENIDKNTRLYYYRLSSGIKGNLWRSNDIVFNLTKNPKNNYSSELTDVAISPKQVETAIAGYNKVKHEIASEPFFVRKIELSSGDIQLGNEVPNVPIREFNAYYSTSDSGYSNPLLVLLDVKQQEDVDQYKYIPNKYLLSKTEDTKNWDIRRIDGSLGDKELRKVLENIVVNQRLIVEKLEENVQKKLTDISKDLIIYITRDFSVDNKNVGSYDSEGKTVYYKKYTGNGYTRIKHCYTFFSFTVREINFDDNHSISGNLPSSNNTVYSLSSYSTAISNGNSGNPLLLYLYYGEKDHWLKRQCADITWKEHNDNSTPTSDVDSEKINKLLEELKIPNVQINISQNGQYQPTGNTLQFSVNGSEYPPGSGFWKFEHAMSTLKQPFTVKSVMHGTILLNGIELTDLLEKVTAYYYGGNPSDEKKLLFVELLRKDGQNKHVYYSRPLVTGYSWTMEERSTKLDEVKLKQMLDALKTAHFPESPTTTIVGSSIGSGLGGAGLGALTMWKGPAILARLITRL
ncbi:hypothetical protein BEWA_048070 [Theileria equi strain WA]|uniref:Uncharacterized protein n=1 Tax=Theileria equi strain WA TaxID=1537102 RepID=L1LAN6_THEEQ|nr:hypothetical protein BEWA_048070 [Theileria equi strain WA]EKX72340.1 hypothetical protein BEWA_048070 [Theileria equi strain WA]|eukprot:XP_004831792.1 hypothetical protein BEWA_048070 [Theileria equi strain WA]